MRSISSDAVDWLLEHAPREHWVELYFAGNRYGHITSNIAESLNAWLLDSRDKPIVTLIESHRHKLMKWFSDRRQKDTNTEGILVSSAAEQVKETLNFSRRYTVLSSNEIIHEVFSPETLQLTSSGSITKRVAALNGNCQVFHVACLRCQSPAWTRPTRICERVLSS